MTISLWVKRLGTWAAAMWIFGAAVFFYLRFSAVFYYAHREAIQSALAHLGDFGF